MDIKLIISLFKDGLSLLCNLFHWRQVRDHGKKEHLSSTRERKRIVEGIREFFENNYELRYNVMKQTEEFRPKRHQGLPDDRKGVPQKPKVALYKGGGGEEWRQLTDRELHRMSLPLWGHTGMPWLVCTAYPPLTAFRYS